MNSIAQSTLDCTIDQGIESCAPHVGIRSRSGFPDASFSARPDITMRAAFQVARQFGLPQAEGGIATATSLRSGDHRETMKSRASHSEKAFARAVGATPIERLTKPLSRVQRERSGGRVLLLATAVLAPV